MAATPTTTTTILVGVDGQIGGGKSTLIHRAAVEHEKKKYKSFSLQVINEAVEEYTSFGEHNPLALAYENPEKNQPFCELYIARTGSRWFRKELRKTNQEEKAEYHVVLTDRTLLSPLPFIELGYKHRFMNKFVFDFLWLETCLQAQKTLKFENLAGYSGIFCLETDPPIALERIRRRGRSYEQEIEENYLINLNLEYQQHLAWWRRADNTFFVGPPSGIVSTRNASPERLLNFLQSLVNHERTKNNKSH